MPSEASADDAVLDVVEVAARLRLAVTRLSRQLRQRSDSHLSPTQGSILATIAVHGPIAMGQLAEREQVASPTITKVINHLHERGLVAKVPDASDRRVVLAELTADGRELLERVRDNKNAWLADRLYTLEATDLVLLDQVADVLERLTSQADQP